LPRRTPDATRDYLKKVPLPTHASTYTVIEHETVIVNALAQLKLRGFSVESEHYRANNSGDVAVGVYHLKYKDDPELGMMFAWANSYDKTMRFKCAVGGFVRASNGSMVGDDFSWSRKHTGTADQEMIAQVTGQILNGQTYYDNLLLVKEAMKNTTVSKTMMAEFLGRAFIDKGLFSKEQMGIVRDEILKPSYDYNCKDDSLWKYYNHMLVALKRAHPRTWMEEHRDIHKLVCAEFMIATQLVNKFAASLGPVTVTTTPTLADEVAGEVIPLPIKDMVGMNLEEFAEVKQDSVFKATVTNPDSATKKLNGFNNGRDTTDGVGGLSAHDFMVPETKKEIPFIEGDVTAEEQAHIDALMAKMSGNKPEEANLNLPD